VGGHLIVPSRLVCSIGRLLILLPSCHANPDL
jgi:hypothetical protein